MAVYTMTDCDELKIGELADACISVIISNIDDARFWSDFSEEDNFGPDGEGRGMSLGSDSDIFLDVNFLIIFFLTERWSK